MLHIQVARDSHFLHNCLIKYILSCSVIMSFDFILNNCLVNLKSARCDKYNNNFFFFLPVIKRIGAGRPGFGRLQKDTKTDELMMEDLGKYVIKNITGRTYWKSCSLQKGMRHR